MHKLYSTKAGGGRRELKLGALHKRGAAYERHDERSARRGRAEGHSERGPRVFWQIGERDVFLRAVGGHSHCVSQYALWHPGYSGIIFRLCHNLFAAGSANKLEREQTESVERRRRATRYIPRPRLTSEASV